MYSAKVSYKQRLSYFLRKCADELEEKFKNRHF